MSKSQQETVEEVLREEYDLKVINSDLDNVYLNGLIEGAKWQAERMYSSLSKARNELYDKLPTGDINAFELLKLIKIHLQKLDDLCGNK